MTKVKICGITNLKDALLAVEAGADALGFIFAPSPRRISPERAKMMIHELPPFISKVGVFMNEEIPEVKKIAEFCGLDVIQFHGQEDVSYLQYFAPKAVKVFEMTGRDVLDEIRKCSLQYFMLDLPKEGKKENHFYWDIVEEARQLGQIILAGDLTCENIETVLHLVVPYAVDVCRGVEEKVGVKNPEKLRKFILKVRKWNIRKT